MKRRKLLGLVVLFFPLGAAAQAPFTLEQILSAPFPESLTTAKKVNRVAWTFNQDGKRNVWVAEGPSFRARRLTSYVEYDGQEISELSFSEDGNALVYTRGEGKNPEGQSPNPTSDPAGVEQNVWSVAWSGGEPRKIDAGHSPKISPRGMLAYIRGGQIWIAPLDGSAKPNQLAVRGQSDSEEWSPDGSRLAFVSERGDHSFIGVYEVAAKTVSFIAPTVDSDEDPVWSLDSKRIAFVRLPAEPRDKPQGLFIAPDRPHPWAIWVGDIATAGAREIWHSSASPQGSFPDMADETGGGAINWAADNDLVVASEEDGWQHLYSLSVDGGSPQLLTPGSCETEQWSLTPDKKTILFNSNCGDEDRRHLWRVNVSGGAPQRLIGGEGIEWSPVVLSDAERLVYLGSDAKHVATPYVCDFPKGSSLSLAHALAPETWPKDFPADQLVVPQLVMLRAADGLEIHSQLFLPRGIKPGERRPALVFLHGGPVRQMLLGWHYMYYYSNSYAMNQYLANRGYVVVSLNYRSGIGYGRAFREAPGRAGRGATEYQDVVAAGKYLQNRTDVNPARVGLWGGSYGGYLTALGLGRNSDVFAAGVDFHGVHDWPTETNYQGKNIPSELIKLAHESSPVASVDTWKSPVLFIHGDDDRNVNFTQTVDLVARLRTRGVVVEQLIFPDEVHDFLLTRDWLVAYHAASDFFDRQLKERAATSAGKPQ
jgi:dipeptidyl aminopeptidase/acylaminoacyl peptidase